MKKNALKTLALLLAAVLVLGSFAGCGEAAPEPSAPPESGGAGNWRAGRAASHAGRLSWRPSSAPRPVRAGEPASLRAFRMSIFSGCTKCAVSALNADHSASPFTTPSHGDA